MILSIIAAYAKDKDGARVIGKDNSMPWHFPHDLERFKEHTVGSAIIMGRKTHEAIGRVLPGRDNIIITRQLGYEAPGAFVFNDLEDAIQFASVRHSETFIIGGQQLYEQCLERADRLYLTSFRIEDIEGDAYFPKYTHSEYKMIYSEKAQVSGDFFRILERKRSAGEPVDSPPPPYWGHAPTELEISGMEDSGRVANPEDLDYNYGGYGV